MSYAPVSYVQDSATVSSAKDSATVSSQDTLQDGNGRIPADGAKTTKSAAEPTAKTAAKSAAKTAAAKHDGHSLADETGGGGGGGAAPLGSPSTEEEEPRRRLKETVPVPGDYDKFKEASGTMTC